jgi:ubiquitin-protein ligase
LIWVLLCAANHQKSNNEHQGSKFQPPRRTSSNPTKGRAPARVSNGTGYGGRDNYDGHAHGAYYDSDSDGYSGTMFPSKSRRGPLPPQPAPIQKENPEDAHLQSVFAILTELLPALVDNGHPFDVDPPNILSIMIKRSPVAEKAADLLRNDSLDDITRRYKLYKLLLGFVKRLANDPTTAQTIFTERIIYPADSGLLSASLNDNRYELRSSDKGKFKAETSRSFSEIIMQLEVSARKMLQRSKAAEEDFETPEGTDMLHICKEICDLAGFLKENFFIDRKPSASESTHEGKGKEPVRPQEDMTQWHREHCVDEIPDSVFETGYHFYREATSNSTPPPKGRMKTLMTELATLQASLPDGIYVRHGASRLDMIKGMLLGPKGTPYEGGLFEFDLFCPYSYPVTPPKMQFKTTGGGLAHFNPNLYADGKVCLSLLGTWSGQPWMASGPNKSTLLQLFISIQSMILCDEPWYNEPGKHAMVLFCQPQY